MAQAAELSEIATGLAAEADASDRPSRATSIEEIRKRTGTKPMSPDDFDRHFGSLAVDGEG